MLALTLVIAMTRVKLHLQVKFNLCSLALGIAILIFHNLLHPVMNFKYTFTDYYDPRARELGLVRRFFR